MIAVTETRTAPSMTTLPRLPLTKQELLVLYELGGSDQPRGLQAHRLGMRTATLIATEERARRKLLAARPVFGDPEDAQKKAAAAGEENNTRERALWNLARLEHFALLGICGDEDVRGDSGESEASVAFQGAYDWRDMPEYLSDYVMILRRRTHERQRADEPPSLSEVELRRFQTKRRLIDLWGEVVVPEASAIMTSSHPTHVPPDRAEAFTRWLGAELANLRSRIEARLASGA